MKTTASFALSERISEILSLDPSARALEFERRWYSWGDLAASAKAVGASAFAGREHDVELVLAVAAALHPASGIPAQEQPFLRTMVRLSIQQGPIRMLAEALEPGQLGTASAPLSLFPLEEE